VPVIECSLPLLSVHTWKGNILFEATILHKVRFNLRQFVALTCCNWNAILSLPCTEQKFYAKRAKLFAKHVEGGNLGPDPR
jgi:hypothetical protein